ncbi:MAG TPA: hypothetical protein VK817_18505 [Trebonia sp.]|jgi:hypothetical protein|nr:hypothetical protein [Trebonia sp.]
MTATVAISAQPFDQATRLGWARQALEEAAAAASAGGKPVPPDLTEPDGWRWRVLEELSGLSAALVADYNRARDKQAHQVWESRLGGPLTTGGSAAIGAVVSAIGAGVIKTSTAASWSVIVIGVLLAIGGSVLSANTYVQNRHKKLRFLRLLFDLWDYAYIVLPTAPEGDVYTAVSAIRGLWESAGT